MSLLTARYHGKRNFFENEAIIILHLDEKENEQFKEEFD